MKAVVANPGQADWIKIGEAPEPTPDSNQAVIRVTTFSVNRGEINRAKAATDAMRVGWDVVGIVEAAATDGSGPKLGARVVGFSRPMHGWAERVALPVVDIAEIPDGVSDEDAATLPVAGLTALYALERCERLLGDRVLVTGATGGVGYFACQLAVAMGAQPVAILRREEGADAVRALGAEVVVSADGSALADMSKFRSIVDGVGGAMFSNLVDALGDNGRLVVYGVSAGADAAVPIRSLMFTGDGRIDGFHLYRESEKETASKGLTRLMRLMLEGRLKTEITVRKEWTDIGEVAQGLIDRTYVGKAVLTL